MIIFLHFGLIAQYYEHWNPDIDYKGAMYDAEFTLVYQSDKY